MIEWVSLSTGARPVPRPAPTPLVWAAAFGGALLLVALLNALAGPDRPSLALAGLSLLVALLRAVAADPDGFRLLFHHAAREPEFRDVIDSIRSVSMEIAARHLADTIPDNPWRTWAAQLVPALTLEAVITGSKPANPTPTTPR